jgi:GNAT superfamily N-acetyltransferase
LGRYTRLRVFTIDLETLGALPADMSRKFGFAWIHDEAGVRHIDQVAVQEGFRSRLGMVQRHLAEGGRVAVAFVAGEPVSWQMLRPQEQVTFVRLHLRAHDAVFSFGSYTIPAWRGHRLMTQLSRFAAATYAGQGFHRMCSTAEPSNRVALRGHLNRGDRPVGWITSLRLRRGLTLVASDARIAFGFFNARNPFVYTVRQ